MTTKPATEAAAAPDHLRPSDDYDTMSFELGCDGIWRCFDEYGLVAIAPTWRELFERTGGRWN